MLLFQNVTDPQEVERKIQEDDRWWAELTAAERDLIEFKFQRALMQLVIHFPFFGFIAARLASDRIWIRHESQLRGGLLHKTMATDGKRLYMWPQYVLYNDEEALMGTLMHEILHIILLHIARGEGHHPELANMAMDYAVNMMVNDIAKEVKGVDIKTPLDTNLYRNLPWYVACPPALHSEEFRDEKTGDPLVWEKIYALLLKKQDKNTQKMLNSGCSISEATGGQGLSGVDPNQGMHDHHDYWQPQNRPENENGEADPNRFDSAEAQEMVRDAHVAATQNKMQGTMPASMARRIHEWLHPPLPWRRLVQNYLKPAEGDWGFQPGDLRFADPMPWFIPEQKLRYILISIDTSGSMSEEEVGTAITQARHLLRGFPQTKGILCMCDAAVSYWDKLEEAYTIDRRYGYGGTSFHPPFEMAKEKGILDQIDLHIYFTDGYGSFPDEEYLRRNKITFDTLWVVTNNDVTPPSHRQYRWTRLNPAVARAA